MSESEKPAGGLRAYLRESKQLKTSVLLVIPLFVAYQIGVLSSGGIKNGVDFVTDVLMALTGGDIGIYLAINAVVLCILLGALFVLRRSGRFRPQLFPLVLIESTVYALLFGSVVTFLIQALGLDLILSTFSLEVSDTLQKLSVKDKIVLSLGAGLYEEIVFRFLLMGGLFLFASKLGVPRVLSGVIAVVTSSLLFSAVHHIGPMGEAVAMAPLVFRFVAGLVLAFIFALRGFAVCVYTHAIYDIVVMVFRS